MLPQVITSLVESFAKTRQKEELVNNINTINVEYSGLKEALLSHFIPKASAKNREKIWDQLTKKFNEILQPMMELAYSPVASPSEVQKSEITTQTQEKNEEKNEQINWTSPMEINLIKLKAPDDIATIKCRIYSLLVPSAIIDTGSNKSVITENLAKRLGLEIDRDNVLKLSGVVCDSKTVGTVHNVSTTIGENDTCTVSDAFAVIEGEKNKPLVVLGVPWLDKVGWDPIVKRKFKVTYKGKTINIPLSAHKSTQKSV